MDRIFILTTGDCCYRYDPYLRARTLFIDDRRLDWSRWTRSERWHYEMAEDAFREQCRSGKIKRPLNYQWYEEVFDQNLAREPEKTLIEMKYTGVIKFIIEDRIRTGYFKERGDRILVLSFFHNDEDTGALMYANVTPEDLVNSKISWLETFMQAAPFIRTVEIPYDFTLTEEYMRGLFEQYVLSQ